MNSYFKYLQEAKEKKIGIQGSCAQGELLKINVINDVQVLVELSNIRRTQSGKCLYSMAMLLGILDRDSFSKMFCKIDLADQKESEDLMQNFPEPLTFCYIKIHKCLFAV